MLVTLKAVTMGTANMTLKLQTQEIEILAFNFDGLKLNGLSTALCLSIAMAVSVNMETLTDNICTNGQNGHMKFGRFHFCNKAA